MAPEKPPGGGDESSPLADLYQDSQIKIDPALKARMQKAAPEVSQGKFRERSGAPRPTLSAAEISQGMKAALKVALLNSPGPLESPDEVRRPLAEAWLPLVRQAVEQAGGDGVDAAVLSLAGKKAPAAKDGFVRALADGYAAMNAAPTVDAFMAEAGKVEALVAQQMGGAARPVSFKALEKDLEGRVDLEDVLHVLLDGNADLAASLEDVRSSLENLRQQIRGSMGGTPNAMLWNFSRLKVLRMLLEAEQRRRGEAR